MPSLAAPKPPTRLLRRTRDYVASAPKLLRKRRVRYRVIDLDGIQDLLRNLGGGREVQGPGYEVLRPRREEIGVVEWNPDRAQRTRSVSAPNE